MPGVDTLLSFLSSSFLHWETNSKYNLFLKTQPKSGWDYTQLSRLTYPLWGTSNAWCRISTQCSALNLSQAAMIHHSSYWISHPTEMTDLSIEILLVMRIDGATTWHFVSANTTQLNQLTGFCHYSNLTYFEQKRRYAGPPTLSAELPDQQPPQHTQSKKEKRLTQHKKRGNPPQNDTRIS